VTTNVVFLTGVQANKRIHRDTYALLSTFCIF